MLVCLSAKHIVHTHTQSYQIIIESLRGRQLQYLNKLAHHNSRVAGAVEHDRTDLIVLEDAGVLVDSIHCHEVSRHTARRHKLVPFCLISVDGKQTNEAELVKDPPRMPAFPGLLKGMEGKKNVVRERKGYCVYE